MPYGKAWRGYESYSNRKDGLNILQCTKSRKDDLVLNAVESRDIACGIGGTAGYESAELHSTHIYTCWKEASTNIWRTAKWLKWFHSFIHFVIQTANTVWHRGAIENVSDFISAPFPRLLNLDILHYLSKHIKQNKKLRLVPDKSKIILAKCPQSGQMAEQNTKIHQGVRF
jgi:hypothetical protein